MDDNVLGAQPYGKQTPEQATDEAWHAEQYRRSFDIIRVKNDTEKDFYVEWDHRYHRIPASGTADVPRFIAVKYCRDMKDKIINEMNQKMHDELLAGRRKKGMPEFTNKYDENVATYDTQQFPKTNDWNLAGQIYAKLWVGLVTAWGKDTPQTLDPRAGEVDQVPAEIKLLQTLDSKIAGASTMPVSDEPFAAITSEPQFIPQPPEAPAPSFSFDKLKENLEKEVTI